MINWGVVLFSILPPFIWFTIVMFISSYKLKNDDAT
jgi:hypothetical protein